MSRSRHDSKWRDPGGDHLPWLCDCHDCRKRRKRRYVKRLTRQARRERDADRADTDRFADSGAPITSQSQSNALRQRKPLLECA